MPDSHHAKSAYDYIKTLDGSAIPNLYKLYGELCQFTHPAAHSIGYLCIPKTENSYILSAQNEDIKIEAFAQENLKIMSSLLMYGFNPGLLILKVLLYMEAPDFHVPPIRRLNFSNIKGWGKYENLMK